MESDVSPQNTDKLLGQVTKLDGLINYQKGSVVSRTIIDKKEGTITLFAFDEGQGLSEHTAPFDALVHILDGKAEVSISGKLYEVNEGEMVIMPANEPHALKAMKKRKTLSFPRDIAPVQVGVYPLVGKDGLPEKAKLVHQFLVKEGFLAEYDESGSIGRRYARADEVGTPLGVTIDYQTLDDDTVTMRDRDTWKQVRNKVERLPELLHAYFRYKLNFEDLGELVKG